MAALMMPPAWPEPSPTGNRLAKPRARRLARRGAGAAGRSCASRRRPAARFGGEAGDLAIEARERVAQGVADRRREQLVEAAGAHAEAVAGGSRRAGLAAREEIRRALRRRRVVAAARVEGRPLERLLELDARPGSRAQLARPERHHQRRVRPARGVARVAHAVRAQQAGLIHAGDDLAARAHAEAVRRGGALARPTRRERNRRAASRPRAVSGP